MLAAENYDGAEPVNLGSGGEITIRNLATMIAELTGFRGRFRWNPGKPDGQPGRGLDTSRAERLFGLRAKTTLEEGLRATIGWYRDHRHA
jgi:GDP-L-fucose synthase